jgi:hypothetical protein
MRAAFGLVAVLVTVFIMVYMFASYTHQTTPAMKAVTAQANQIAGRSSNGVAIGQQGTPVLADSKFVPIEQNSKLTGLQVTVMPATNGLAEYFGLAVGDVIESIGPFKMGDDTLSDSESARNWVQEGMQRQMTMTVNRGGQVITLPADRNTPVPAIPLATPATPGPQGSAQPPAIATPNTDIMQGANFSPIAGSGRLLGLKVTSITPSSALAQHFGLTVGDVISGIGPLKMGEQNLEDQPTVLTKMQDAYTRNIPIYVDRNGEHIILPAGSKNVRGATNSRGAAESLRDAINRSQNSGE